MGHARKESYLSHRGNLCHPGKGRSQHPLRWPKGGEACTVDLSLSKGLHFVKGHSQGGGCSAQIVFKTSMCIMLLQKSDFSNPKKFKNLCQKVGNPISKLQGGMCPCPLILICGASVV